MLLVESDGLVEPPIIALSPAPKCGSGAHSKAKLVTEIEKPVSQSKGQANSPKESWQNRPFLWRGPGRSASTGM